MAPSPCTRCRVCAGLPLLRVVGSVLVQGSMSHHIHTRLPYSFTQNITFSLLGGSWGWWWVRSERGLGAACAALGSQRAEKVAAKPRPLQNPQCAHTGTLNRVGHRLHRFPL